MNKTAVNILLEEDEGFDPDIKNTEGVSWIDMTVKKEIPELYDLFRK